ncbi:TetR/AcrR family transcriptional regulator [Novosphingobium album (ex Liu et al. 2023)]|uniref:Helix-turn-helix domain containing protein n=1 Tax=Novosphingobium album (ex Liu et al. 2023) TaxID=3031130 RepID=A0ABT5WNK9_9SPHN|nr:TetR/AcrR family transcriptional regulator [Novosphingobium album (ex Liu et al. 2023)]MDE8651636.1 helix-turn-helix domain containing protein [Novosphingobium album (ex Liu et al. 2023)]
MGRPDSATFNALLDATETVMRNEGYAAATSRRIALEAGVKQQLVYYYFRTMDELLLATFKRRTERALAAMEENAGSAHPIQSIWANLRNRVDARLVFEFVALANHHAGIRAEVARYVTQSRRIEAAAIARQFARDGIDNGPIGPGAAAFVMYAVSLLLERETSTGITEGHDEVRALIDWMLGRLG